MFVSQKLSPLQVACFIAVCLFGGATLYSQVADAHLVGAIVDPSQAVVPNASVELFNEATGVRAQTITDKNGSYRFLNVPAGSYTLKATARGFAASTVKSLAIMLNRTQTANIQLEIIGQATSVVVNDSATLIDATTPALQTTFASQLAIRLPVTGSAPGVLNLSLLSAGVGSSGGLGYGAGPSVGGQRPTNNNFMIEGADTNNRTTTGPVLIVPNEAVTEFAVQQNQFSPEFGHSSGGQFNTIVKGGTNEFRGSAFHYLQNRRLNALDAAHARQGLTELPRYDQNRFGGTFGGPIKRNQLFFFQAIEAQLRGQAASSAGAVYTPTAEGKAALEALEGISRNNLNVFSRYAPIAPSRLRDITVAGRAIPVGIPNTVGPAYSNDLRSVSSIDAPISDRDQLRGRWITHRGRTIDASAALPEFYTPVTVANHVVSLAHFHTFSPTVLNEVRFAYNRANEDRSSGSLNFPGLDAFPSLQFDDLSLAMGPHVAYPQSNRSNVYQVAETLTWMKGSHTVKAGYDVRKVDSMFDFVARQRGEYTYNTLERYLLDLTPEWGMRSAGAMPFIGDQISHYAFVNDEWRMRPNLTMSFGLRYEFVGVPEGARSQALNEIASVPGVLDFRSPKPSRLDFAPRIGLAWSPGMRGRSVIRAGFGLVYDQNFHNLALNSLPPQYSTNVEAHVQRPNEANFLGGGGIPSTAAPVTTVATARSLTSAWIPDQQRPYSINWTTGVQQSLANDYNLEVRYLGTRGVHLPVQMQLNRQAGVTAGGPSLPVFLERPSEAALDGLGVTLDMLRPVNTLAQYGFQGPITTFAPRGNSSYHGLATQLSRRYNNGLQFLLAYTWSHNIDDSTAVVASTLLTPRRPQDFFDLGSERANSMLDHRHRLTAAWVYDLNALSNCAARWCTAFTRDWTVAGNWTSETGTWATVRSNVDANLNLDPVADRAIVNPAGNPGTSSTVTPLLNSAGKTVGYLAANPLARYIQAGQGVYPNGGRNTLLLPGIANLDLSIGKRVRIDDRRQLQFRIEAYNAFNHAQFVPGFTSSVDVRPRVTAGSNTMLQAGHAMFNRSDLAFESNSRKVQVVLRLEF